MYSLAAQGDMRLVEDLYSLAAQVGNRHVQELYSLATQADNTEPSWMPIPTANLSQSSRIGTVSNESGKLGPTGVHHPRPTSRGRVQPPHSSPRPFANSAFSTSGTLNDVWNIDLGSGTLKRDTWQERAPETRTHFLSVPTLHRIASFVMVKPACKRGSEQA